MYKVNAASIPRSEKIYGRAVCEATDNVGGIIRVNGNKSGNIYSVKSVVPSELADYPATGVIVRKDAATDCIVQFHGPCAGLYGALLYGQPYYVGIDSRPAGVGWGNFPTVGSGYFQQIGIATSNAEILLVFLRPELTYAIGQSSRRYQQTLIGDINGANLVYNTAISFRHGGVDTETVYCNGVRLYEGVGNDYVATESGGPGTGYDTITMNFAVKTGQTLFIDYTPAV